MIKGINENRTTFVSVARAVGILGTEAIGEIIDIIDADLIHHSLLLDGEEVRSPLQVNRVNRLWRLMDALEVEQARLIEIDECLGVE